jgi:hypothetical protein
MRARTSDSCPKESASKGSCLEISPDRFGFEVSRAKDKAILAKWDDLAGEIPPFCVRRLRSPSSGTVRVKQSIRFCMLFLQRFNVCPSTWRLDGKLESI